MSDEVDIKKRKKAWLNSADPNRGFELFFDYIPGISIFAKDRKCTLMRGNKSFLERFNLKTENDLVGKTDYDFFPKAMADHFRRDDQEVMDSAVPKMNILETFFNRQGLPDWYLTHKMPIFSHDDEVIGIMGITKNHELKIGLEDSQQLERLAPAIEHIRNNFRKHIDMEQLAKLSSLSLRQFDRVFKLKYGVTPLKFMIKTRVQAACEELRKGDIDLATLAVDLGFYDQSSFTLHFRRNMGITPGRFRKSILTHTLSGNIQ